MITRDVKPIIERIRTATPESAIAVWLDEEYGEPALRSAFANTVISRRQMALPTFIGEFSRADDLNQVRRLLRQALREASDAA